MLMLCVTGLPLIFHEEIDELLHGKWTASVPAGTPKANLDQVVANAISNVPEKVPHFLVWDRDEPDALLASVGTSLEADPTNNQYRPPRRSHRRLPRCSQRDGAVHLYRAQVAYRMFTGLPGKLFLGLMGILFCVAIVSGVVVYSPSMRKLRFGTYRLSRPRIVRWLDCIIWSASPRWFGYSSSASPGCSTPGPISSSKCGNMVSSPR